MCDTYGYLWISLCLSVNLLNLEKNKWLQVYLYATHAGSADAPRFDVAPHEADDWLGEGYAARMVTSAMNNTTFVD